MEASVCAAEEILESSEGTVRVAKSEGGSCEGKVGFWFTVADSCERDGVGGGGAETEGGGVNDLKSDDSEAAGEEGIGIDCRFGVIVLSRLWMRKARLDFMVSGLRLKFFRVQRCAR